METPPLTKYDEVLYPSYPMEQTHPDRLATLASLFGMKPAPVETCRVLELGCGDGGNLIPMAFSLTGSRFTGIDLSSRAIAMGQEFLAELKLENVCLRRCDLMQIGPDFGEFDYIIAHGVYSWVPAPVRDKILSICKANLAPSGVAYVSYNALPGGHLRQMTRDMMLFHTRNLVDPKEAIYQARALVKFLSDAHPDPNFYGLFFKQELERVTQNRDALLFHDDLEETNVPVYFWQFIEHAAKHGMQYLAEADFFEMHESGLPANVVEAMGALSHDQILREQYLDFVKVRKFRQTLLCREGVKLNRTLKPEQVAIFAASSSARPVSARPDICSRAVEEFRNAKGRSIQTDHPLAKAALLRLGEVWPRRVRFDDLLTMARELLRAGPPPTDDNSDPEDLVLGEMLLKTYAANATQLHLHVPELEVIVTERPRASLLARLQASKGMMLTTMRHTSVKMEDPSVRRLIQLMDGTRDRAALLENMRALVTSGELVMNKDGTPIERANEAVRYLEERFEENLAHTARLGLLVA